LRAARDRGHGGFVSSNVHEDSPGSSGLPFPDAFSERLAAGIGRRARLARRARRMKQADVAARLGVTTEFYARIERGGALPSVTTLARLVDVLDLELNPIIERAAGGALPGAVPPSDPPAVRRVLRRLRRATPSAWRLVLTLLEALDVGSSRDPAAPPHDPG
jgi:transcriptional regulator with XRE-family HTH domain